MKPLIYLLEDDLDISRLIARTLAAQGMDVRCFQRLAEFQDQVAQQLPDLSLIDLSLPDGDGMSVVHSAGLPETVPRMIVTGRRHLTDRVVGLEVGADDYIVKPFEPRELVARVRAVLRRSRITKRHDDTGARPDTVRFGPWRADFEGCLLMHDDGQVVKLSSAEASLLSAFVRSAGRVMSRGQLLDATVGRGDEPFDRSMDARISRLRRKLRDDSRAPQIIRTVYGAGYVFSLSVEE